MSSRRFPVQRLYGSKPLAPIRRSQLRVRCYDDNERRIGPSLEELGVVDDPSTWVMMRFEQGRVIE